MKLTIVLPCLNEAEVLEKNVLILQRYLLDNLRKLEWQIVVADNNSTDDTAKIGKNLSIQYSRVHYFYLPKTGKGGAVLTVWQKFKSDYYVFMDADLSTDISHLKPLVEAVMIEGYDLAVGSRYIEGAEVKRSMSRKMFSYGYRVLLKIAFGLKIKDAPCGFKAVNHKVVENIVPKIKNKKWFFDTELLVLAQKGKYATKEIPVKWQDKGRETKVKVLSLSWSYFKEVVKLFFRQFFIKL